VTVETAPAERRARLEPCAEVMTCGHHDVELAPAMARLYAEHGARVVVVEGGPSLNGTLAAEGLVDEVCLSMSPMLVSGTSTRICHGGAAAITPLALARVLEADGMLFLRYARR
jgi:riboflavin biosynthesis pyrimidine reductase